jgi:hypothetical protein
VIVRKLTVTLSSALLTLGVCAPALPAVATSGGRSAATTVAPGTIVLPPAPNDEPMPVSQLVGSSGGIAYVSQDGTSQPPVLYRGSGTSDVASSGMTQGMGTSLVGSQLVVAHPGNGGFVATSLDISNGTRTDLAEYQTSLANLPDYFVTGTGDGWLDVIYTGGPDTYTLTRHITGGGSAP